MVSPAGEMPNVATPSFWRVGCDEVSMTAYAPAATVTPSMRYLSGSASSSERYQPVRSTGASEPLYSSIQSFFSLLTALTAQTSLMYTPLVLKKPMSSAVSNPYAF